MKSKKHRFAIILLIGVLFAGFNILIGKTKPILPDDQFAFSPTPQNGQAGNIEGLYYHRASSMMEILDELSCKADGWDDCTTYLLLRFYKDGVVVEAGVGSEDRIDNGDLQKLQKWLNRETEDLPNGQYFISGNRIWLTTRVHYDEDNRTVTADYSGFVLGNILVLDGYSHYNGYSLNKMIFMKMSDENQK